MVDLRLFAEPLHLMFLAAGCPRTWLSKLTYVQDLLQDPRGDFFSILEIWHKCLTLADPSPYSILGNQERVAMIVAEHSFLGFFSLWIFKVFEILLLLIYIVFINKTFDIGLYNTDCAIRFVVLYFAYGINLVVQSKFLQDPSTRCILVPW